MLFRQFALFVSIDVLLWAGPCACMRKKAALLSQKIEKIERLKAELLATVDSSDKVAMQTLEDVVEQAKTGMQRVEDWNCSDMTSGLHGELIQLDMNLQHAVTTTNLTARSTDFQSIHDLATSTATTIMGLDEKRCLREAMQAPEIRGIVESLNSRKLQLLSMPDLTPEAKQRLQRGFARLAAWQEALVGLGSSLLDRDELYPRDITSVFHCPSPCMSCHTSFGLEGMFKGESKDSFECILSGGNSNNPPSKDDSTFACATPTRRMWVFWEFKTRCTVPGWIVEAYDNARIAAMVTCGMHSIRGTLQSNVDMPPDVLRTCMLAEQRQVVTIDELNAYTAFMGRADDGVVEEGIQHSFGVFLAVATAEGIIGLRDSSNVVPPAADETWEQLLRGSDYTLLPPSLVQDVPCNPPVNNWEVFLGGFAAIAGIAAGGMLAALASIPMVLLSGFFYMIAGFVFLGEALWYGVTRPDSWDCDFWQPGDTFYNPACDEAFNPEWTKRTAKLGTVMADTIPNIFTSTFTAVSSTIYNVLVPAQTLKPCPRGVLFLPNSAPICVTDMEKLEAKRYTCPEDESRSIVISCEPSFNGVAAIRGQPCGA